MINNAVIVGRITKDPEVRTTSSGVPYVRFSIAVDRKYGNKENRQVDFVPIVAWRQTASFIGKYVRKGFMLGVEGSINVSEYKNNDGNYIRQIEVSANSVQLLERKSIATTQEIVATRSEAVSDVSFFEDVKETTQDKKEDDKPDTIPWDIEL